MASWQVRCIVLLAAEVLLMSPLDAGNGRGLHTRMFAVPVPGKVVIDGKLDDWDLSGQVFMYVVSETSDSQSARFALMYDAQALYLSGVVRDPNPLMNRHDPQVDGNKGWNADSCQFRIVLDPGQGYPVNQASSNAVPNDQMAHLILWYYTDRKEPCLQMHLGMDYQVPRPEWKPHGVVPHDLYEAAYLLAPDGRGSTFEYRIPWTTFGAKRIPRAGDLVAGTVQFNWSRPDGLETAGGSAWAYDIMNGPGFTFQSSACWGKIIFAEKGNLPRDLVEDGVPPEKPLPLRFEYEVPEESEVTVTLFDATNRAVRLLAAQAQRLPGHATERWDGLGDDGKPLPAGTYAWRGLYHQPIKTKFILAVHNSGQPPYKLDDNTGGWGGDHGCPTTVAAVPGGLLLAWNSCESGWGIIRTNVNGKKLWGSKHCATHLATDAQRIYAAGDFGFEASPGIKVLALADSRPLNFGNGSPYLQAPPGGDEKTNGVTGLACHGGTVYVAYGQRNLVALFDAAQGTLKETWPVPTPGALAVRPDGRLLVVSGDQVMLAAKDQVTPLAREHLDQARGLAVAADGTLYVANAGKLQAISVFGPDGKYLRSIGKDGGRPAVGAYDPSGILEPGGIALDEQGRLWVAETLDAPKRHSVWDVATGKLVTEFFGASSYFGWAYMDPKHPDEIYCHNVLWRIDWKTNTYRPVSTIWRATTPNMINAPNPGGYAGHFRVMTAKNGKQFGWGMVDYSNMLYLREGDVFKPIAGTIRVAFGQYGSGILYPAMKDFHEQHKAGAYLWQDANNDQTVQPEELTVSPAGRGEIAFNWVDADLNVWCDAGWMYRPVKFADDGRPVYDFSKREEIPFHGGNANATSLWLDPEDDTVYTLNLGQDPSLARWTRDHKLLWGYSNIIEWNQALNLPMLTPGKLYGLTMPLGVAGDFTGAADYFGPYHLFTRDGLYVAMVMRDGRTGGLGADITASEVVTGQLVKPEGMNRYFLLAGDQDGRVTEILGLDTVKRLAGGTYVHTEDAVKQTIAAQAQYAAQLAKLERLVVGRGRASLDAAKPIRKVVDETRSFTVRAAYDEQSLYLAYVVTAPCELVNTFPDPRLIFKGGNLIDLQLGADPAAAPKRAQPVPGDVRVLVSRRDGKPVAVVYRPHVAGFQGQPIVLNSPTGKESFDEITPTEAVGVEYQKTNTGFTATVKVPLALLGWTPKPGTTVRLDVGYLFGNATGTQTAARAYWSNNGFAANVTNDVPNESRLVPAEWGAVAVE